MTSLYKISEQIISIIGRGEPQEIIQAVRQAYGTAVQKMWAIGKEIDLSEVDGATVYTFKNQQPVKDDDIDMWYIEYPSTYIGLPNEMGINSVQYMKGSTMPFVRIGAAGWGLFANLKSKIMGGNQVYQTENTRMYFPAMKDLDVGPLLVKLSIALDTIDVDENINIPVNVIDMIIEFVLQRYGEKQESDQTLNN